MGQGPAADPEPPGRTGVRAVATVPADVAAPHWLTQLLKPTPAPIDWKRAARAAAAVALPIAIGVAVGHIALGALVSIGSLCGTVTAISGPYRDRLRRSGFAVLAGGIGFFLGDLVGERGWWTAVLIVVAAVVSAVISAAGNNASLAGLQLLVQLILGTHESTVVGPGVALAGFAVGAGWALLLSLAAWPIHATAPERALVANVFDRLADLLSSAGTPGARAARQRLTAAMNNAYDALLAARSRLQGRDRTYRKLFLVLSEATPAIEAGVALASARHRAPKSVVDATIHIGQAVRADVAMPATSTCPSAAPRRSSRSPMACARSRTCCPTTISTPCRRGVPGRARATPNAWPPGSTTSWPGRRPGCTRCGWRCAWQSPRSSRRWCRSNGRTGSP